MPQAGIRISASAFRIARGAHSGALVYCGADFHSVREDTTAMHRIVFLFFFLSGFSSLVFEVLWERMLMQVFGATTFAISTLLTAFMAGLALGSVLGGRVASKLKRPLLVYGLLEGSIGLYALLVPWMLGLWISPEQGAQQLSPRALMRMRRPAIQTAHLRYGPGTSSTRGQAGRSPRAYHL